MRDERNELARQRRAANPGSGTEYSREWRRKNHDRFALRNREAARRRQTGSAHSRVTYRAVLERDGMVCHICGGSISDLSDLHFDHVIPLSKGGAHSLENIRPAHALCNMRKSDKII
jgi:5-methylcytosine-specific restriction endonuclease McrA